ncbi:hypothetical protein [Gordonia malaquae]|uniref:hypothetical protein n=1 Tax=Gordonia malaquae TaxID=410332 RepID=UPI003019DF4A
MRTVGCDADGYQWEVEVTGRFERQDGNIDYDNVGGLGPFASADEARSAAQEILYKTVGQFRAHALADPYGEASGFPDAGIVEGVSIHRFNADGIDWNSAAAVSLTTR